ncbi:MAG: hypothetical protein NTX95_08095 [Actinobacteria bacterium]|nr:hypothetical protein [Actinomycetota bacterium]
MRKSGLLILVALACLCLPSLASAKGQLLYSVTSGDLNITRHSGVAHVSVPAKAKLSWFTDRPQRLAGAGTAADIAAGWVANGFDRRPPNAALVTTSKGNTMQTIVTLRKPVQKNGRVTFAYSVVGKGSMLGMRTTGRPAAGSYRGELFIDDATTPPCSTSIVVTSTTTDCVAAPGNTYYFSAASRSSAGSSGGSVSGCSPDGSAEFASIITSSGNDGDLATGPAETISVLPCSQTPFLTLGAAAYTLRCLDTGKRIPYCLSYQSNLQITVSAPMRIVAPT